MINLKTIFALSAVAVILPGCAIHRTQVMSHEDAQRAIEGQRAAAIAASEQSAAENAALLKQRESQHADRQAMDAVNTLMSSNDPALRAAGAAILLKMVPSTEGPARDVAELIKMDGNQTVGCQVQSVTMGSNGEREYVCAMPRP